ncbi:M14 family metallopeptidase [Sutcliffiella cohnii]
MLVQVRKGDSLWYYSQLFSVPLEMIEDANKEGKCEHLPVGSTVKIPAYRKVTVDFQPGDTLWTIAASRKLHVDSLYLLNPHLQNVPQIEIGVPVQVPVRIESKLIYGKKKYCYETMMKDIKQLEEIYPFIKTEIIGHSVLGRAIPHIKIGNGQKHIHINGSFHANEWITTAIIMTFINDLLLSLTNKTSLRGLYMYPFYDEVTLSFVPMVNPDGVDLVLHGVDASYKKQVVAINGGSEDFTGWKANIRGVDLNNQYPANWDIEKERKIPKAPAFRDYPGNAPLTEPEAIIMEELANREQFDMVLAFHTQGEELYWGYEGCEPNESEALAKEFELVSSYKAVRYVDSHAGYKDWFIQKYKKPGFTIELGKGVNPLPLSQFDEIYVKSLGIFLASMYI